MDRIARASTDERRLVFEAAAQRMALAPAVVEKDFWVCYTLDHLFHRSGFAESMVFKGGTSLSKAFGLIERFSEDIDLILDWRLLGFGEDEPWEPRSNSAQERFKADSIERTNAFLADAFAPKLRATLSESLGTEASVRCGAEEETVYFDYPRSYESAGTLDTKTSGPGPPRRRAGPAGRREPGTRAAGPGPSPASRHLPPRRAVRGAISFLRNPTSACLLLSMLMYGKEASNRKQEIDRQHYTIPNQRPKDKHCGKI